MDLNEIRNISEKDLVKGCLQDERYYQEALYRRYADDMYSVVMMYAKNEDEAADILQEAFITVFRKLDQFRFDAPLGGWIRRIAVNKAIENYRKKSRKEEVLEEYLQWTNTSIDDILEKLSANEIIRMVNELPDKAALVLKLYSIEGYQHKEIAEKLKITEGTSKSQLNRARSLLQEKIIKSNG